MMLSLLDAPRPGQVLEVVAGSTAISEAMAGALAVTPGERG